LERISLEDVVMVRSEKKPLARLLLPLLMLAAPAAQAQFAVIDVASVTQLVQQAQTLAQQLEAARQQISQAQALYESTTGSRGMQQLLAGVTRNYLPSNWTQLAAAMQGAGGTADTLGQDIRAAVASNAVLSAPQMAALSAGEQSLIGNGRVSVALSQALSQQALANSSGRFASIQQLIAAIPSARDQKGILELQARIGAEQAMLQNEQTKLQVLYQAAQSQVALLGQQTREQVIAGQGSFASRFRPSPL
jgi:type IV secretion system protein VirB5